MSQPQFTFRFFFVKCTLHFTILNINRVCQKYSSHIWLIVCFTLCVRVLCLHVCLCPHMWNAQGSQSRKSHPLGLGLQVVVSYQGLAVLILGDCQFKSGFKNETLVIKVYQAKCWNSDTCSRDDKGFRILGLRSYTWTQRAIRATYELHFGNFNYLWQKLLSRNTRRMIVSLQKDNVDPVLGVVWLIIDSQHLKARGSQISQVQVSRGAQ